MSIGAEMSEYEPTALRFKCPECGCWERIAWHGDSLGGSRKLDHAGECYHCDARFVVKIEVRVTPCGHQGDTAECEPRGWE